MSFKSFMVIVACLCWGGPLQAQVSPEVSQQVAQSLPPSFAPIMGHYRVESLSEEGLHLVYTARIEAYGESFMITWTYPSGSIKQSLGLLRGHMLAVVSVGTALSPEDLWVGLYEATPGDTLEHTVLTGIYTTDYLGGYRLPENLYRTGL